jgi:hypothetical protein
LALAGTGPIAILLYSTVVRSPLYIDWVLTGFLVIARSGAAPLLAVGFFVSAIIAPARRQRLVLLGASAIEAIVSAIVFITLFVWHMR